MILEIVLSNSAFIMLPEIDSNNNKIVELCSKKLGMFLENDFTNSKNE